ncbi:sugar phosphate isomerase/epimerase family protein [Levilactobacillus fujinensis]|uniref:Sugar phosphate isomerase/epimerase family protein n=1 Tax=Levilactobacillus fujinensis TaxID=2486024 RepID=A0ABW1TK32_9LACO|nr:sugar phosphate isomerase/epimerase [Levilactobacillus fujinensis]
MSEIVINTLVYQQQLDSGIKQADLLKKVAAQGVSAAEIRREYIKDFDQELADIKAVATKDNLKLFYSVPENVFIDGHVNSKLDQYMQEAKKMGIFAIKFNIGDYAHFAGNLKDSLRKILDYDIQVNVENDQTQTSGTMNALETFLINAAKANLDIQYVYDLGNWRFVKQDEFEAIKMLKEYVRYIHVKDVAYVDSKPQVVPLDDGEVDWRKALDALPSGLPIAVEYPVKDDAELRKGIELVKSYLLKAGE